MLVVVFPTFAGVGASVLCVYAGANSISGISRGASPLSIDTLPPKCYRRFSQLPIEGIFGLLYLIFFSLTNHFFP